MKSYIVTIFLIIDAFLWYQLPLDAQRDGVQRISERGQIDNMDVTMSDYCEGNYAGHQLDSMLVKSLLHYIEFDKRLPLDDIRIAPDHLPESVLSDLNQIAPVIKKWKKRNFRKSRWVLYFSYAVFSDICVVRIISRSVHYRKNMWNLARSEDAVDFLYKYSGNRWGLSSSVAFNTPKKCLKDNDIKNCFEEYLEWLDSDGYYSHVIIDPAGLSDSVLPKLDSLATVVHNSDDCDEMAKVFSEPKLCLHYSSFIFDDTMVVIISSYKRHLKNKLLYTSEIRDRRGYLFKSLDGNWQLSEIMMN